jgi:LysM repeat protein
VLAAAVLVTVSLAVSRADAERALTQPRLSIASPAPGSLVGGLVQVAVAFDAGQFGKVTALELWVNDRFYASTQVEAGTVRGTFNLDLDTFQLRNGQHELKVRALAGRKVIGIDASVVTITNGGLDVVPPLVSFKSPMDGDTISGITTIDLTVSDNDRVAIVSLFANKLPLMLKSSPPYTYRLDTTTLPVQDGKTTILLEALAYDRSENAGKAKSIRVTVENPANATPLQPDPAAPKSGEPGKGPTPATTASPARDRANVASLATSVSSKATAAVARAPKSVLEEAVQAKRATNGEPRREATLVLPLGPPIRATGTPVPGSPAPGAEWKGPATAKAPATPPRNPGRQIAKAPALPVGPAPTSRPTERVAAPRSEGSRRIPMPVYVVRPVSEIAVQNRSYRIARGDRLSEIARDHGVTPQSILVANGLRSGRELRAGTSLVIPGTFSIAMNDQSIGFDVSPRIEEGLPIAPFRHIFEHAGGSVVWHPEDRSVTASKPETEIRLEIGSDKAAVNQAVVILDRAAFIDSGRTMVPLRFVTEALELKAEYDPKTGTVYLKREKSKLASLTASP